MLCIFLPELLVFPVVLPVTGVIRVTLMNLVRLLHITIASNYLAYSAAAW